MNITKPIRERGAFVVSESVAGTFGSATRMANKPLPSPIIETTFCPDLVETVSRTETLSKPPITIGLDTQNSVKAEYVSAVT